MATRHDAQERGMQLNIEKAKTEVLWNVTGRGSRQLKLVAMVATSF